MNKNKSAKLLLYPINALVFIIALQLISHFNHAPIWLLVYVVGISLFGVITYRFMNGQVSGVVRTVLVLISLVVFFLYYKFDFTVDMAVSFLLLASALKLLELRHQKELVLFVYVMLYLSAASFLFSQGFFNALLQLIIIFSCLYVLFKVHGGQNHAVMPWGSLLKVLFISIPIVLICFLFFPRIAPLWSIPIKTQNATMGMSDFMAPGDIASLAQSSERAFRVSFSKQPPKYRDLYWRGGVLDSFDGRTWKTSTKKPLGHQKFNKIDSGVLYDHGENSYEVMLEPHNQRWVFSLASSRLSSSNVIKQNMGIFRLRTDAIQATRYKMTFKDESEHLKQTKKQLLRQLPFARLLSGKNRASQNAAKSFQTLNQDLQLATNYNLRTRRYIEQLQVSLPNKIDLVRHLMRTFAQQKFFYTLKPALLGDSFIDEFLFETKQGFCAHYAGSLAYMLRLANIPARVVTGYQGGEYNRDGNYFIIHQYDAHAWVEAKLPEFGWVRLDPTAMVAPERILRGLNAAVGDAGGFLEHNFFASAALNIGILSWARLQIDSFNYSWQKGVVNFSGEQQQSIIKSILGDLLPNTNYLLRISVFLAGIFGLFFIMIMGFIRYRQAFSLYSRAEKYYLIWLFFISRFFNYTRKQGETPNAFLKRIESCKYSYLVNITAKLTIKLERDQYQIK